MIDLKGLIKILFYGGTEIEDDQNTLHSKCSDPVLNKIDAQTHYDLSLDEFYKRFNNTHTSFGDEVFYHWLHTIKKDFRDIQLIICNTKTLQSENQLRIVLNKQLGKIGKQHRGRIVSDLWEGLRYCPLLIKWIIPIVAVNILLAIILTSIFSQYWLFILLALFIIHLIIYISTNTHINNSAGSVYYFSRGVEFLLNNRSGLERLNFSDIPDFRLFKKLPLFSYLFKHGIGGAYSQDPLSLFLDYLRVFFCLEAISYRLTMKKIDQNKEELRKVILFIGAIDCCLNNVDIIENYNTCFPTFQSSKEIEFTSLQHPLVENCIEQSGKIEKNAIVTGLNMAGKSTFLKSIALNQIISTGFGIAFAQEYKTNLFHVITSLRLADDIINKKSKYYVEAERLIMIQDALKKQACLCLIDEILTGTNTEERVIASTAILKKLSSTKDSIIIAATHDTTIAKKLEYAYKNYYFDGTIEGEQIKFDYLLKPGIVSRKNGLLILRFLGIDIDEDASDLQTV